MINIKTDCTIIGGGVAGLWTALLLKKAGYQVVVLEQQGLGQGQTINSQGILHSGTKYLLSGLLNDSAKNLTHMPQVWADCLHAQTGPIDLNQTQVAASKQFFWSNGSILSGFTTFMASKILHAQARLLEPPAYPSMLQNPAFKGLVYELPEIILDVQSLLNDFRSQLFPNLIKIEDCSIEPHNRITYFKTKTARATITSQVIILTAGANNGPIGSTFSLHRMQIRPLRMAAIKHPHLKPFWGHAIGAHKNPLLSISSHYNQQKELIWYLGGELAESNAQAEAGEHIQATKTALSKAFKWIDWKNSLVKSIYIERAEAEQATLERPNGPFIESHNNLMLAWPTKLTFAPDVASSILQTLQKQAVLPLPNLPLPPEFLEKPEVAAPAWDF